jgi:phosphate transport system permease protein
MSSDAAASMMSADSASQPDVVLRHLRKRKFWDGAAGSIFFLAAVSSIIITVGIVAILVYESGQFFAHVPVTDFVTGTEWEPLRPALGEAGYDPAFPPQFGIWPLVCGTLATTVVALAIALPIGTVVAMYLSEFAPFAVREIIKPMLELLSAVPTVVYGYFALQFVSPLLIKLMPELPLFNMLTAGIVMGIMIIPYVSSLSEDAMRAVPMLLREGAYGLGANRMQTGFSVVFPAALSGIAAAYVLAISRAVGETMIVAIAAGQQPTFTLNPLRAGETITAYIARVSQGDVGHVGPGFRSIFAAGMTLFVITLAFNILGHYLRKRYRQAY